ncbi:hypothetical protein E2562_016839 [Oryza meyeriana var. granulata]|uniref:Uncharacterized protein n=1 Tax=Oryza meyeriana var. granulata TaxID=110450 RepID=A0A6G1BX17_9ORYZ|nr:hypothetical protein E2562_016839 [Oryza meyeriana var. granulata]
MSSRAIDKLPRGHVVPEPTSSDAASRGSKLLPPKSCHATTMDLLPRCHVRGFLPSPGSYTILKPKLLHPYR